MINVKGVSVAVRNKHRIARIAFLMASSAIYWGAVVDPVHAQQAAAPVSVTIAAGPLDDALHTLSSQAGVQLIYTSDLVSGKTSTGVTGRMSVDQAVAQLLRGTGLTFRVVNGQTVQIELPLPGEAGERVLGAVRVEGAIDDGGYVPATRGDGIARLGGIRGRQDAEADGYRAKVANVGTGAQIAIEDIPRSLSVLTQEQIDKEDITTVDAALERLPGVTINQTGGNSPPANVYVRGYLLNQYQIDGGPSRTLTSSGGTATLNLDTNLDAYERVELLRGPNALFGGADSPGGSLNLVRKRPGAAPAESVTFEVGSNHRVNAVADISTPSLAGTPIAFRGVASIRRENSFVDDYKTTNGTLYGIFDAPLGDAARLEVGGQYTYHYADGEYDGALRAVDGTLLNVGRRFNYTSGAGAYHKTNSKEIFSKLYIDLKDDWGFELGGFYNSTTQQYRSVSSSLTIFRQDGSTVTPGYLTINDIGPVSSNELGISSKLTGRFNTFGLTHNTYASLEYNRTDNSGATRTYSPSTASINSLSQLFSPNYQYYGSDTTAAYSGTLISNTGIVLGDTVSWRKIVSLSGIVRRDSADNVVVTANRDNGVLADVYTSAPTQSGTWRPSFSLTVKPIERLSLYGSYADGFTRQDGLFSRSGKAPNYVYTSLQPSTYKNKEVGVKYGGDKWLATLSLFDLRQVGAATNVEGLFACPASLGSTVLTAQCYSAEGNTSISRGVDLDFTGQIVNGLNLVLNYNYDKTKIVSSGVPLVTQAPQSSASAFIDWRPSFLPGFGAQIGARYKGRYYTTGNINIFDASGAYVSTQPFTIQQSAYTVVDLGLDYQIDRNLAVRLFIENLTDKTYLSTLSLGQGNFYGRPRSFMASLRYVNNGPLPANGRSPTTGLAPFGDPADWYAAFDSGANVPGVMHAKASGKAQDGVTPVAWNFHTKAAPAFAARLGYHLFDNVRSELEFKYRTAQFGRIGGASVAPYGVCGAEGSTNGVPFDCNKVPGKTDNWSLMANVLYDFGKSGALFRPFVGAGVGMSRNSVNFQGKLNGIGGTTPWQIESYGSLTTDYDRAYQETIASAGTTTSFTWQAIAGGSIRVSNRLSIDGAWRYVSVPNMRFSSYNIDAPADYGYALPLTPRVGTFKTDYNSHMFTLGLRWAFGET